MQIIGFNFTRMSAEKQPEFNRGNSHRTNIEFLEIKKEEKSLLNDKDTMSIKYQFSLSYFREEKKKEKTTAEIVLEGSILIATEKNESTDLEKAWKKKAIPQELKLPLFNMILRKCSPKAILLEEEVNLPCHLPIPQVRAGAPEENKEKEQN